MIYRIAAGLFALLFVLGGLVQYNDPDPGIWIATYVVAGAISGAAAAGKRSAGYAAAGLALMTLVWGAVLSWGVVSEGQHFFDEEGREAMGLGIIAAWNVGVFLWGRKKS